jgi:hypothetical protein
MKVPKHLVEMNSPEALHQGHRIKARSLEIFIYAMVFNLIAVIFIPQRDCPLDIPREAVVANYPFAGTVEFLHEGDTVHTYVGTAACANIWLSNRGPDTLQLIQHKSLIGLVVVNTELNY